MMSIPESGEEAEEAMETGEEAVPVVTAALVRFHSLDVPESRPRSGSGGLTRKLSQVVTDLGPDAADTLKVLQRYYTAARPPSLAARPASAPDSLPDSLHSPLPGTGDVHSAYLETRRKTPVIQSPYESLYSGAWLRKLSQIEAAKFRKRRRKRCQTALAAWLFELHERPTFRHLLLLASMAGYSLLGGIIFHGLEGHEDGSPGRGNSSANRTEEWEECGMARYEWNYWSAVFYSTTLITTIGYGNISPSTTPGRLVTILYASFGIPLVIVVMADLGQFLLALCQESSSRLGKALRFVARRGKRPTGLSPSSEGGPGPPDEDFELEIRLQPALLLIVLFLFASAGIFCWLEPSWDFVTSLYFVFMSLSTIGLGDVVPRSPRLALLSAVLIILGLSLVSFVVSVAQHRVEAKYLNALRVMETAYQTSLSHSHKRPEANGHGLRRRGSLFSPLHKAARRRNTHGGAALPKSPLALSPDHSCPPHPSDPLLSPKANHDSLRLSNSLSP